MLNRTGNGIINKTLNFKTQYLENESRYAILIYEIICLTTKTTPINKEVLWKPFYSIEEY